MQIADLYHIFLDYPSVQTDTRKLKSGDLFFALKGDNFNGNKFAQQAIDAGAVKAVIDEKEFEIEGKTILVNDVLTTLQALAKHHREKLAIPVLAITGSNGKTTTKELVHAVLASGYRAYTTEGNLNNHIGIPLTILKIKKDAEIAVIEMGANHQKEIEGYCKYAEPTHGLITNAGKAHLEGFGGEEGVRKGKGELFDYLRANHGTAFIMKDYEYLQEMSRGIPTIISYGTKDADTNGVVRSNDPLLSVAFSDGLIIDTQLVGEYNLPNVLAAVAVGRHFKISDERIKEAIERYAPSNSRSQLVMQGTNRIILDAYNANPSSMKLAIENFAKTVKDRKVLMLGAMAELGNESIGEHEAIVKLIDQYQWDEVVLVGGDFMKIDHRYKKFPNSSEARDWLASRNFTNTNLLVKGSRSMQMETVLKPGA
jgi:UDP-N-acetylmuramoyl-tripeptide--D-alanyl-D-alanine ligase